MSTADDALGLAASKASAAELSAPTGAAMVGYQAPYGGSVPLDTFQILRRMPLTPEQFGAVADFDFATWGGTDNTSMLQNMINAASQEGREIKIPLGKRYLTDTLRAYYDASLNPEYAQRPGRIKITGEAQGYATGAFDASGAALVHKNSSAAPLLDIKGTWLVTGAPDAGGFVNISGINLAGGNQTTAILYCEAVTDQLRVSDVTTRRRNGSGKGIDLISCWKVNFDNILNRGIATGLGPNEAGYNPANIDNGIGLDIRDNGNGGQINMAVFNNVENYRNGYGTRVGRRANVTGTYGPLVWIGGQDALNDFHGFWVDGGVYALTATGRQIEQSRMAGLRIDSNGATDKEHNIIWKSGYFTHCGKVEDGTADSYAINIVDGVGVKIDRPVFQNARSGIIFDRSSAKDLEISRPLFRTVSAWGASSGVGIGAAGMATNATRITVDRAWFDDNFATNISANAKEALALAYRISNSANSTQPNISISSTIEPAKILNLNYSIATTITNILGGAQYKTLLVTFSSTNATMQDGANMQLNGDFTPSTVRGNILLFFDGVRWQEVSRYSGA